MKKLCLALCLILIVPGPPGLGARPQQTPEFQGDAAAELMTYLLRHHPYVFAPRQLVEAEALYRRFRELEGRGVPDWHGSRRELNGRLSAIADRMLGELPRSQWVIPVDFQGERPRLSLGEAIPLPGNMGALILKLTSGSGRVRFALQEQDLSALHHDDFGGFSLATPMTFEVPQQGKTWGVVALRNLPQGRTTLMLRLQKEDGPPFDLPFHVSTPSFAQLGLQVLSDDTGEPSPAMIQMSWNGNDVDFKPPNAIDFAPQFDNRGSASGYLPGLLPGDLGGRRWWCVPGPFQLAVPPGEWEILIRRGLEHTPLREVIQVGEGQKVDRVYRPRRWVDMRRSGWYSGDDHVHAQILSDREAAHLMAWIKAEDIHLVNVVKMGDIFRTYFEQRGFGPDFRVVEEDYAISPGQECPRTHDELGHTLSMNILRMTRDPSRYFLYDWVFDTVHAQGGLTGYAHVVDRSFQVHRDMSINVPKGKVDFVELMQFGHLGTDLYYDFLDLGFKLTASAGSDVPWGGTIGEVRLYAYLGDQPFSPDHWFEAVRRGRTFVTNGPMIEFQVDSARPGDELHFSEHEASRKLQLRARAWGDAGRSEPALLEIIQHGRVLRERRAGGNQGDLALAFELEVGNGSWVAARARGKDGSEAHTTPVYIRREPLRFWNVERAAALLEKRLASLAEVEDLVDRARRQAERGEADSDWLTQQLARQGTDLLQRVQAARDLYRNLQRTLRQEQALRRRRGGD